MSHDKCDTCPVHVYHISRILTQCLFTWPMAVVYYYEITLVILICNWNQNFIKNMQINFRYTYRKHLRILLYYVWNTIPVHIKRKILPFRSRFIKCLFLLWLVFFVKQKDGQFSSLSNTWFLSNKNKTTYLLIVCTNTLYKSRQIVFFIIACNKYN